MDSLLTPLSVKGIALKNRIVMPPMASGKATQEGLFTEELIDFYAQRARHGIGLVIVEHSYVNPMGRVNVKQLGIHSDRCIEGLTRLATIIKAAGSVPVIQITHGGSAATAETAGTRPVSASSILHPRRPELPRRLSRTEIDELVSDFVRAAWRAREAGFAGVEIHGAHGYLLNQFHSPLTNRRSDEYGGPLANRMRLSLRIVREIRRAVGEQFLIMFRLGADDRLPGGLTVGDAKQIAQSLCPAGVDILDLSGGLFGAEISGGGQGYLLYLARAISPEVPVPVIITGGITEAAFADQVVRRGDAALVGIGRALLKDPAWAAEAYKALGEPGRQL